MNILVFNSGSSSLKYQLIDMNTKTVVIKGNIDRIGESENPDHSAAIKKVFKNIGDKKVDAIGHRVVHGGQKFTSATLVTKESLMEVENISHLAPLHNPANLMGIKACRELFPKIPNVMVFDTAFHATIPPSAFMYAIGLDDYKKHGIRRYGFHGTSHDFVSRRCAEMYGKPCEELKIITCHIGNGCSICAIDKGKSVETSMGLTPLEGLVMGTRSGDIDPAAVQYIAKAHGFTLEETINYLNKKCGLLALGNIGSSDVRDLIDEHVKFNKDVQTAFDIFFHRITKYVGAYSAVMNGVDAIAFTGGIGNNWPMLREKVMKNLGYLGAVIDVDKNLLYFHNSQTGEITQKGSRVRSFVIRTDEELEIALQTAGIL